MRHALAMFGFCLFAPQAAFACMPMEGAMGTQAILVPLSFFLGVIMLFGSIIYCLQIARLPAASPLHDSLRRRRRVSLRTGLCCIGLCFMTPFIDLAAVVIAGLFSLFLYRIALPTLAWLVRQGANALHSIKIAGEKTSSTRRLAAAGDVQ